MDPANATRTEIREYVRLKGEELLAHGSEGGNIHQKALDHQDEVDDLIRHLPDDQKLRFLSIYTEELRARTAQVQLDTSRLVAESAQAQVNQQHLGTLISGGIAIVVLLVILFKLLH